MPRFFTVDQANAMLPLVRAIVRDWSELANELIERQERLSALSLGDQALNHPSLDKHDYATDYYTAELRQMRADLAKDTERLTEFVVELRKLGVEPGDAPLGIVDFPSLDQDRPVRLCWKLDEPAVQYWHEPSAGFAGRQPLPAATRPQLINDN
jgi:hypothetical protein